MGTRAFTMLLSTLLFAVPLAAQPIPFEICTQSATWVRPSPEEQAKIWNNPRYRAETPDAYAWTHNFLLVPNSASIAYDLKNLSGLWTAPPLGQCDSAKNPQEREYEWIEVWVLLHRVTQITHDHNTYTITLAPTGAGFQSIMFPRLNPSVVLRFITSDGKELEKLDESARPNPVKNEVSPGTRIIGPNGEIIKK